MTGKSLAEDVDHALWRAFPVMLESGSVPLSTGFKVKDTHLVVQVPPGQTGKGTHLRDIQGGLAGIVCAAGATGLNLGELVCKVLWTFGALLDGTGRYINRQRTSNEIPMWM